MGRDHDGVGIQEPQPGNERASPRVAPDGGVTRGAAGRVILAFDGAQNEALNDIRKNFVGMSFGERDPDCAGIAAPVFGPENKLVGALSVSGPKSRFTPDSIKRMSEQVRDAAVQLTRALGGRNDAMSQVAEANRVQPMRRSA